MADLEDAALLRSRWKPDFLKSYDKCWIAFRRGDVIAQSESLGSLLAQFDSEIGDQKGPLFAFVDAGIRQ